VTYDWSRNRAEPDGFVKLGDGGAELSSVREYLPDEPMGVIVVRLQSYDFAQLGQRLIRAAGALEQLCQRQPDFGLFRVQAKRFQDASLDLSTTVAVLSGNTAASRLLQAPRAPPRTSGLG